MALTDCCFGKPFQHYLTERVRGRGGERARVRDIEINTEGERQRERNRERGDREGGRERKRVKERGGER